MKVLLLYNFVERLYNYYQKKNARPIFQQSPADKKSKNITINNIDIQNFFKSQDLLI